MCVQRRVGNRSRGIKCPQAVFERASDEHRSLLKSDNQMAAVDAPQIGSCVVVFTARRGFARAARQRARACPRTVPDDPGDVKTCSRVGACDRRLAGIHRRNTHRSLPKGERPPTPSGLKNPRKKDRERTVSLACYRRMKCLQTMPNVGLSCEPRKQAERRASDALRSVGVRQIQALVGPRLHSGRVIIYRILLLSQSHALSGRKP